MTLMGLLLLHVSRTHLSPMHSLRNWGIALLVLALGQLLLLTDQRVPSGWGLVVGHGVILLGFMLVIRGLRIFFGEVARFNRARVILFLLSYLVLLGWFTSVNDNVTVRGALFAIYGVIVLSFMLSLLFRHRAFGSGVTVLIGVVALLAIGRMVRLFAAITSNTDFSPSYIFDPSPLHLVLISLPGIVSPLVAGAFIVLVSDTLVDRLEKAARQDQLTGVLSKAALQTQLKQEVARSIRYQHPMSLMMIDLDNFKHINDTQGHLKGDETLQATAQSISKSLRTTDLLARFGGDEFTAIMIETEPNTARVIAQRTLQNLNAALPAGCSASIGVATLDPGSDDAKTLMQRADKALYQAKRAGKSRVAFA